MAAGVDGLDEALKDASSVTAEGASVQARIHGVEIRRPPTHADERGTLTEIYDLRWGFTDDPTGAGPALRGCDSDAVGPV